MEQNMIKNLLKRKVKLGFRPNLVFGTIDNPLMVLEKYNFPSIEIEIEEAFRELREHLSRSDDSSHTWGYFPQYCQDKTQYPACIELGNRIKRDLICKFPAPENSMSLSFIRLADGIPISDYGGLHVDVDSGISHQRGYDVNKDLDIIRLILNLGDYPRTIEHIPLTKDSLRNLGYDIPEDNYRILSFSSGMRRNRIEIPPREHDTIYGLKFWSSQVPHAGITDEMGHFVMAFGCYADLNKYRI